MITSNYGLYGILPAIDFDLIKKTTYSIVELFHCTLLCNCAEHVNSDPGPHYLCYGVGTLASIIRLSTRRP